MNVAIHIAMQAAAAEKRILDHLRQCEAFTVRSATEYLPETSMEEHQLAALIEVGAVVQPGHGFYYLDEAALAAREEANLRRDRRLRWAMIVLIVVSVSIVLVIMYLTRQE